MEKYWLQAAVALVAGGQEKVFTPMQFFVRLILFHFLHGYRCLNEEILRTGRSETFMMVFNLAINLSFYHLLYTYFSLIYLPFSNLPTSLTFNTIQL